MSGLMSIAEVLIERVRQDLLHGRPAEREYSNEYWLAVLTEEVGEVAKSIQDGNVENLQKEITQVAAVAIAFLEAVTDVKGKTFRAEKGTK